VAAFLSDYGLKVRATGFLGRANPRHFERLFAEKGIDDRFVRIAGSTRIGIKVIDETTTQTTDINFPGQTPTPADLEALAEVVDALAADCPWFIIAGSIPASMRPDVYAKLITAIRRQGGRVALDTSGAGLCQALPAGPTLIKPNLDELIEYCGRPLKTQTQVIDAAKQLLNGETRTVVVSMGGAGALFVESHQVVQALPPKVSVKSTVGAGDAMLSGMVAGKLEARSLEACARLATAFSVVAVTCIGAGLPQPLSLSAIEDEVRTIVIDA
jgi:1-phosphofructokinase